MAIDSSLWTNIIEVIESKLEGEISLKTLDMLNQIRCHVQLNGKKLKLERPFKKNMPIHLSEDPESSPFLSEVEENLRELKLWEP